MKFTLKKAFVMSWPGLKGWAYNSKEDFDNVSAAYFEVKRHGKVKSTRSDRVYYVIDGEGEFNLDGKIIPVKKTDVIIVPKNTPYDYWAKKGVLKLFMVHVPAFHPDYEVNLETK